MVDYLYGSQFQINTKEIKKEIYAIGNINKKDLSKIFREFEKLPYKSYERGGPKNEPTDYYFYLSRHIVKFMMRADALNLNAYPVRTEMTGTKHILILRVFYMDKSKSEELLVGKTLSQVCSTNKYKSKIIIVDENSTE